MDFETFKSKYLKVPVQEYPNQRAGKKPLVTVRVLSYNHAPYVVQCLDSILMQETDFDYEVLIAEDDSNDGTREICIDYAKRYPEKIRLLLNSRENNIHINGKPSGLFNSVYSNFNIQSKYIALCETDDYWLDKFSLQKRVDVLEQNEDYVLCYHRIDWFLQESQTFKRNLPLFPLHSCEVDQEGMISKDVPTSTLMYRNHLIEKFDEKMKETVCGDVILRGKLSEFGTAWYCADIKPSVYRQHKNGSYSGEDNETKFWNTTKARTYLIGYLSKKGQPTDKLEKTLSINYLYYFIQCLFKDRKLRLELLKESKIYASSSRLSYSGYIINFLRYSLNVLKTKFIKTTTV